MIDEGSTQRIVKGPDELVTLRRLRYDLTVELRNTPDVSPWMRARRVDLQEKINIIKMCEEAVSLCLETGRK
jgi:hypothetical protein